MNHLKAENIVSATIHARYALQESVITIDYDPATGESRVSSADHPDPAQMDTRELVDFLERVELEHLFLSASTPEDRGDRMWIWQEELGQMEELCDQIKDEMAKRIGAVRDKYCVPDWDNYVDSSPSMGLERPEDYILYWYIHGEFPYDMDGCDMKKVWRELQDQLDELLDDGEGDGYWDYQCIQRKEQLKQIKEMMERCIPEDDGVQMEKEMFRIVRLPYFGQLFRVYNPEERSRQELVASIEQIKCYLLHREDSCEKETIRKTECEVEQEDVQWLLDELNRCLLKKLGVVEIQNIGDEPAEFHEDHFITSWARGSELKSPQDIIACWYLSECFPWGLSFKQLAKIEQKLKVQMVTLEAKEADYEDLNALELWRFRMDIRAEQLEQIQTMMRNFNLDCEE